MCSNTHCDVTTTIFNLHPEASETSLTASDFLKGYLRCKTITYQNVPSEAQVKNFFV